jgi:transposase-like protein
MTNSPHVVVAGTRRVWSPEQKRAILAALAGGGRASGMKLGGAVTVPSGCSVSKARRHRNSVRWRCIGPVSGPMTNSPHVVVAGTRRVWSPEQKILAEAVVPGSFASARMARFCSGDQTRRVPATTTCACSALLWIQCLASDGAVSALCLDL